MSEKRASSLGAPIYLNERPDPEKWSYQTDSALRLTYTLYGKGKCKGV